jgi:thimet oligopeptidase
MKQFLKPEWVIILALLAPLVSFSQKNPLLNNLNEPINFKEVTPADITGATEKVLADARVSLEKIYAIPVDKSTFKNTVQGVDDIEDKIAQTYLPINILYNASPDSSLRNEAEKSLEIIQKFFNELSVDEKLYNAYKSYAKSAEAKKLTGGKRKVLDETIERFERNGFALPAIKRKELQQINDSISNLSIAFTRNIAANKDHLLVSESAMKGLPADFVKNRKKEGEKYIITLDQPTFVDFMKYSESDDARKQLYIKYNNRAADKNLEVLKLLLLQRMQKANLLNYSDYASYQLAERMAKNPATVWKFENNLLAKVKDKTTSDMQELLPVKRKYLDDESVTTVEPWEYSFLNNILMMEKYNVDQTKVKEYLKLDNVLDGLFKITENLFGVQYVEVKDASVWHPDVRAFDVKENGVTIGRFYIDFFPRENKFTHAACFPIRRGKQYGKTFQLPMAALICNFNAPTSDKPSLLSHRQAITLFHEFGHVLHNMFSKSELATQAGTSVKRDFVEAPSQIFENWVWNYDALQLFAKHYQTGEILPKELFTKMLAARYVGSGLDASAQINYGMVDMSLHYQYDPTGPKATTDVVKDVFTKVMPFKFVDGTNFQASFGHLTGYAAGYYGYMWSKVYAEDMFSIFEQNGIMDKKTGMRYRTLILAKGGTKDENEMVKEFLGRESNEKAFYKSLGIE